MKETLKRIKADIIVSALLCIALGIVLLATAHFSVFIILQFFTQLLILSF